MFKILTLIIIGSDNNNRRVELYIIIIIYSCVMYFLVTAISQEQLDECSSNMNELFPDLSVQLVNHS